MNWFPLSVKQFRSFAKFFGLFCLCFVLVISCGKRPTGSPNASTNTGGSSDRLTVGTTLKPRTLDPADAYELAASNVLYSLGDRLYTYKLGTDQLEPQLATALPKISPDGLTYTIPLRQGVVFHDDTPFNAAAMTFSLERFIKNGGKPSSLLSDLVESVKASGEYELTIKLKNAFAPFPSLLAYASLCAVSPKAYEIGIGKFTPTKFVGTGPYKLVQFSPNSIRLDVFDKYWGKKPPNQGIDFEILTSSANLYNSVTTGAVDIAYQSFDPDQIVGLQNRASSGGWQVIEAQSNVMNYMVLNTKQKPLDQPEVRQAIASMLNRKLINERVLRNQGEPAYSMIPKTFDVSKPVFEEGYGDGNITKAKELLTKAGFSKENPLKLEVWYSSGSAIRQQIASLLGEYAKQQLEGILQIQPQAVESATFFANIRKGIYQSALLDWYPDFTDADNYIQPLLSCTKGSEATGCEQGASQSQGSFYYSDRMNKLIQQERAEQNPQKRKQIFVEIQDLLAKDVPLIPLWQSKDYAFAKKGLQGVQLDPILQLPLWQIGKNK
ncbi:ABC transporter substrate-binding protein [Argonema antarcticum]|uniref:ABC transporter substrate-binding protein n=1 Tax=Argonema antarcticum TaxID=2942763 RepID=UPI0020112870|nr:ABC transporter substrate-binding protein [Argonema antarcticum]MCL1472185.1 ABC transporter substrate-binding protein [Argonema antarcticum A004/B2]